MTWVQLLATFLFFVVFVLLFVALVLYISVTLYNFWKPGKEGKKDIHRTGEHEIGKVKIDGTVHISGPLEKTEKEP